MALTWTHKDTGEIRVHENTEELSTGVVNVFPRHIYSINDRVSVDKAATEYEFSIRQMVKKRTVTPSENSECPKFDLILLGMGK
ncbi:hypothetical protein DY000_02045203 [Brassica cretica]|uniref:Glucosamine/galactosamine-6-phosphate isomerase domain-containing protein n=1 Tax=Brassica cretica TaxID=69181 RepID=A0ABQ7EXM6_BRACR|nr:hypothetical protein DY000_02045203 [Brassica cretica]